MPAFVRNGAAENVILESNSILGWLQPDLYATVVDPRIAASRPPHCAI